MKKFLGILLGLSLAIGTASLTFAQDKKEDEKEKKKGKKKKKEDDGKRTVVSAIR
jgi:hypothetical protein